MTETLKESINEQIIKIEPDDEIATIRDRITWAEAPRVLLVVPRLGVRISELSEAPFMLALLGPAVVAGSWQIGRIVEVADGRWLLLSQPLGFVVALIGLMGKLEMPPFAGLLLSVTTLMIQEYFSQS